MFNLDRGSVLYDNRHGPPDRIRQLTRRVVDTRHLVRCRLECGVAVTHHLLEAGLERGGVLGVRELDGLVILGDKCCVRNAGQQDVIGVWKGEKRTEILGARSDDHK